MDDNLKPKSDPQEGTGDMSTPEVETDMETSATESATDTTPTTQPESVPTVPSESSSPDAAVTNPGAGGGVMPMVAGVVILGLAIVGALWLFTDSERSVTGEDDLFGQMLGFEDMEGDPEDPVAVVNGTTLTRAEYNRIRQQVFQNAQMQGANLSDPTIRAEVEAQAMENLINTELIRQAAVASGASVSEDQINARYREIEQSVGGREALQQTLSQFGMTEESLRGDVEQEITIQQYLESSIDSGAPATEQEIQAFYDQAGGEAAGLPPLEDVRVQVEQQIQMTREQELIAELLESLRAQAEIEILI